MASLDQLKQTFFDECGELLQQIEIGSDRDARGRASRTIPSTRCFARCIRSRAAPGYSVSRLWSSSRMCSRRCSTRVRQRQARRARPTSSTTLLTASDVLSDLVTMSRVGRSDPAGIRQRMPRRAAADHEGGEGGEAAEDDNASAPADFDGLDFMPVRSRSFDERRSATTACAPTRSRSGRSPRC